MTQFLYELLKLKTFEHKHFLLALCSIFNRFKKPIKEEIYHHY